jgi:hypothetical protein
MLNKLKSRINFHSKFNFSTLVVPEIMGNKFHSSVYNLMTAAKQADSDVRSYLNRIKYFYTEKLIISMI